MKTERVVLALIVVLIMTSLACRLVNNLPENIGGVVRGSGNVVTEERPVSGVSRVELTGIGDLQVTLGDQESLTIEAEENLIPLISTEVRGNTLTIGTERNQNLLPTEPIRYYLTVPSLESVSISGLSNVNLPDLSADSFQIEISGAGNATIDSLQAGSLDVALPGLGGLEIHGGQVPDMRVVISGAGNFNAPDLQTARASVDISGMGSTTLRVSEQLDASISGSGSVKYYGNPSVNQSVSGLGRVEKLGD
jgi:hypothetical protein